MRRGLVGLLLAVAATAVAAPPGSGRLDDWRAIGDSLRGVQPKLREQWLRERGFEWPGHTAAPAADSGLSLVGKWGRGPSVEVTGQDTLVALSLGSEVALLDFARPDSPRVLAEIQLSSMAGQARLAGNRLYTNSTGAFEVWDITDPANPVRLGGLGYGIGDFQVFDTLLFFIKADTFRTYSVADPAAMYQLGACRDSGYFLCATREMAVLGHSARGLYLIDVSVPANPHRAGAYSTDLPRSAELRGNLCCATVESGGPPYPIRFLTLDISNPASPHQLGVLNDAGGYDLFLDGPLVFASGKNLGSEPFHILSVADSAHPVMVGQCQLTDYYNWGVWAAPGRDRAYVANSGDGVAVLDIANLTNPRRDTSLMGAGIAVDLEVSGNLCFVAGLAGGLKILDVTDPATPYMLGELDSLGGEQACYSVAADDSFAYGGWFNTPFFRVADVSDPSRPEFVGWCDPFEYAQDMVLRDTLVYAADHYKFEVVNVARPRQPQVVGTCNMVAGIQWGVDIQDTFAYCGSWDGLTIVNIARADSPYVVSQTSGTRLSCDGVAVRDSLVFVPSVYETLWVYSVANPQAPYPIAGAPLGQDQWGYDATMVNDTLVFVGCRHGVKVVNVRDPAAPTVVASHATPSWVRRVEYAEPCLYACCSDAGVMILETELVGIAELGPQQPTLAMLAVKPVPASTRATVEIGGVASPATLGMFDVAGREVSRRVIAAGCREYDLDLSGLRAGLYYLMLESREGISRSKLVRQ